MKSKQNLKPTYYTIESDGTESVLHVDSFTKNPSASKERIRIIHVDGGITTEQFREELQKLLDARASAVGGEEK